MTHAPATDRPDLTTRAGRKAYRHELRMVAARPRRVGLLLLGLGMLLALLPLAGVHSLIGWSPRFLGLGVVAVAVPFLITATVLRGRYHRRRASAEARHLPG
jgi:hypothetical protein